MKISLYKFKHYELHNGRLIGGKTILPFCASKHVSYAFGKNF